MLAVFCTVAGMIAIYIVIIIWARHMDKKDITRVRTWARLARWQS